MSPLRLLNANKQAIPTLALPPAPFSFLHALFQHCLLFIFHVFPLPAVQIAFPRFASAISLDAIPLFDNDCRRVPVEPDDPEIVPVS